MGKSFNNKTAIRKVAMRLHPPGKSAIKYSIISISPCPPKQTSVVGTFASAGLTHYQANVLPTTNPDGETITDGFILIPL